MIRILRICFVAIIALNAPTAHAAVGQEQAIKQDAVRKINLAGRQRMLSQRMTKAACLARAGLDEAKYRKVAGSAAEEFTDVLAGLRVGDSERGLLPENTEAILTSLTEVETLWLAMHPLVQGASDGALSDTQFRSLHRQNVPLLKQMNAAVGAFERHKGEGLVHPELKVAINIAGRQRMLSQKAAKELCMIHLGIYPDNDRAALKHTIQQFEAAMNDLIDGNPDRGVLAAPTADLGYALISLQEIWDEKAAPLLKSASEGGAFSADDVLALAEVLEEVLFRANEIVWMYEAI